MQPNQMQSGFLGNLQQQNPLANPLGNPFNQAQQPGIGLGQQTQSTFASTGFGAQPLGQQQSLGQQQPFQGLQNAQFPQTQAQIGQQQQQGLPFQNPSATFGQQQPLQQQQQIPAFSSGFQQQAQPGLGLQTQNSQIGGLSRPLTQTPQAGSLLQGQNPLGQQQGGLQGATGFNPFGQQTQQPLGQQTQIGQGLGGLNRLATSQAFPFSSQPLSSQGLANPQNQLGTVQPFQASISQPQASIGFPQTTGLQTNPFGGQTQLGLQTTGSQQPLGQQPLTQPLVGNQQGGQNLTIGGQSQTLGGQSLPFGGQGVQLGGQQQGLTQQPLGTGQLTFPQGQQQQAQQNQPSSQPISQQQQIQGLTQQQGQPLGTSTGIQFPLTQLQGQQAAPGTSTQQQPQQSSGLSQPLSQNPLQTTATSQAQQPLTLLTQQQPQTSQAQQQPQASQGLPLQLQTSASQSLTTSQPLLFKPAGQTSQPLTSQPQSSQSLGLQLPAASASIGTSQGQQPQPALNTSQSLGQQRTQQNQPPTSQQQQTNQGQQTQGQQVTQTPILQIKDITNNMRLDQIFEMQNQQLKENIENYNKVGSVLRQNELTLMQNVDKINYLNTEVQKLKFQKEQIATDIEQTISKQEALDRDLGIFESQLQQYLQLIGQNSYIPQKEEQIFDNALKLNEEIFELQKQKQEIVERSQIAPENQTTLLNSLNDFVLLVDKQMLDLEKLELMLRQATEKKSLEMRF